MRDCASDMTRSVLGVVAEGAAGLLGLGLRPVLRALEPIEDQVQAEHELEVVVVMDVRHPLDDRRVFARADLRERRADDLGAAVLPQEEVALESEAAAPEHVHRRMRQLVREAAAKEIGDYGVVVMEQRRAQRLRVRDEAEDPRMYPEVGARGERAGADRGLPLGIGGWRGDLAHQEIDHAIADVVFAPHVVVERHRLHPERLSEPAHGDRPDPVRVRDLDGGAEHPLPAERGAGLLPRAGGCPGRSAALALDSLTLYGYGRLTGLQCKPKRAEVGDRT